MTYGIRGSTFTKAKIQDGELWLVRENEARTSQHLRDAIHATQRGEYELMSKLLGNMN